MEVSEVKRKTEELKDKLRQQITDFEALTETEIYAIDFIRTCTISGRRDLVSVELEVRI